MSIVYQREQADSSCVLEECRFQSLDAHNLDSWLLGLGWGFCLSTFVQLSLRITDELFSPDAIAMI